MHNSSLLNQVASPFLHLMTVPSLNSKQASSTLCLMAKSSSSYSSMFFQREVNTTITGIVYTDKHLAIYKVGKVLLPMDFFTVAKAPAKSPSLAPEPSAKAPKADKENSLSPDSSESSQINSSKDNSGTVKINVYGKWLSLVLGVVLVTVFSS
ncbi:hypothetical protein VIGAN_06186100 [Vigna angularis var. angularis]|uniref:FAS1 domain-containing protein n=1 Tax=Vigna angularis var. angularis TaxID=157739 RepID=A0A0S3SCJ3_PHAAN|nr:hypothetical protein VIGAN_06186100 [Vigna angularis var. angularis]